MATDRVDKIAARPELAIPELFSHGRKSLEHLPCRDALDDLDEFFGRVHGHRLYQKMHVILVCADFKKMNLVPFRNLKADLAQDRGGRFGEH